jgi:hypothetical protein
MVGSSNAYVSQTINGCESPRATIAITINAAATASISTSGSTTFCQGGSVTLTANSGSSYIWFNGATQVGTSSAYTATSTGNYTVQVSNPSGCTGQVTSSATTVTVNPLPTATISAGGSTTFCQGGSVTLTASAGASYIWFNGATQVGTSGTYTATTSGNYTVQVTNPSGCVAQVTSAATTVTVNALPTATITAGGSTTFCQGASVTLTASPGSFYSWFNGATQVGTSATYTATSSGTYTVQVTNASNCSATSSATTVTVNASPTATITAGGPTSFCQGGSVTLTASTGSSYIWFNGATQVGTGTTYTATTSGNYTVQITNPSGCVAQLTSAATTVIVNALPTASITPNGPTTFAQGGSVVLNANTGTGFTYRWFNGSTLVGTGSSYTATTGGNYTVEVSTNFSCTATSSIITVIVNGNLSPFVVITAPSSNASFTAPASVTITATASDQDGTVSKVDFYSGNTLLGTDPTAFHANTMNNLSVGTYTITAVATDNLGAVSVSAPLTFTVNPPANEVPVIAITSPSNGSSFVESATLVLNATATDVDGTISLVEFYNGTTLLGSDANSPYSFTWMPVSAGSYVITAKATDNNGGIGTSSPLNITVTANQPSVITITSPVNNSTVTGTSVAINVNVTDPDGGITLVEYLDGTTVIGTSTTAPYSYTWNNAPDGTHEISVRVTDSNGGVTTSSPVTMVVDSQTGIFNPSSYGVFTNVYPNPSIDGFKINASQEIKNLWIVNMHGVQVGSMQDIPSGKQVEIGSDLSDGAYVLMIKYASEKMEVARIVKIK